MTTSAIARELGRLGGRARARRLSPQDRRRVAALGGQARRRSLDIARRIAETLRYATAALALRGGPSAVRRVSRCTGPIPGLYPEGR